MRKSKSSTAIKRLFQGLMLLVLCGMAGGAWAAVAGTIVQLSGPLLAKKPDGVVRILSLRSEVNSGETLVTEKNTYAMVKFIDNSEITLKPATIFKVENFSYDADKPDGDTASFNLVKGGLRSVTGLLGKRNKEKFAMKTPSATIGIRGTTFTAEIIEPAEPTEQALAAIAAAREAYLLASTASLDPLAMPAQPLMLAQNTPPPVVPPGAPPMVLPPGLYVSVSDGAVSLINNGGSLDLLNGQLGFTPSFKVPPTKLPSNPGIKFSPPPSFVLTSSTSSTSSSSGKANSVDCEVR